ncbi:SLC13 family permease [bacterium]|nr:SLC13 family permease [bacterium]MDC0322550.1 SLC13 family permease [Verrucomicrobiales bacterium]
MDWGTILLFGGGLTLGKMLSDTGLAETLGLFAFNPEWGVLALVAAAVLFGIIMSEFSSNTASAAIVIPIMLTVLAQPGFEHVSPSLVIMACAFGASYGFMLPVSTPPNAIVYGTGRLKVRDMFTTGILFDLTGAVLIIGAPLLLNRLGIF